MVENVCAAPPFAIDEIGSPAWLIVVVVGVEYFLLTFFWYVFFFATRVNQRRRRRLVTDFAVIVKGRIRVEGRV